MQEFDPEEMMDLPEEMEEVDSDLVQDATVDHDAESEDFLFKTFPNESETDAEAEPVPTEKSAQPALTINIQSWATPVVGLVMLIVGLAGGYFLRPAVTQLAAATPTPVATAPQTSEAVPTTAPQASAGDREALMAALMPQVRHFKGDPNAPITLIEFSDFQ